MVAGGENARNQERRERERGEREKKLMKRVLICLLINRNHKAYLSANIVRVEPSANRRETTQNAPRKEN